MKKFAFIFLGLILITGCSEKKEENKFVKLGYSDTDIEVINTLSNPDIVLNYDYNPNIINLIKQQDFKEENLDKYIKFSTTTNLENDNVIFIVNNNYDDENINYDEKTLSLMHQKYFIFNRLDRYLNYNVTSTTDFDSLDSENNYIISKVNANLDYDYYTNVKDTDLSKGYLIIANKYYKLTSDYVPENLVLIDSKYGVSAYLEQETYEAFKEMYDAALNEDMHLYIRSPYRSYSVQNGLYEGYAAQDGYAKADTYSARPGYSEHQTGLAFDVTTSSTTLGTFENTKEFAWMKDNSYKYGFILRYPEGKEDLTGYIYEPWHYRYVGKEVAKQIYDEGITFDEYYAYYIEK